MNRFFSSFILFFVIFSSFASECLANSDLIVIPKGNTLKEMPAIPEISLGRHAAGLMSSEYKNNSLAYYKSRYQYTVNKLLKNYTNDDFKIKDEIIKVAKIYEIDPIHIFSAIVAEHVFNFDLMDNLQEYSVKLVQWKTFFTNGDDHPFLKITQCSEMKACTEKTTENERWQCYIHTYESQFKSKMDELAK